jgi:hypothetical protein
MEDYIKDYIVEGDTSDPYLNGYILLVLEHTNTGQPIFTQGVLDQPYFFTRFVVKYIQEGYREQAAIMEPPRDKPN